jgi:aldoxime dehydratase
MVFHIEYSRVIPERKPEGHKPAPRYTLRWQKPVGMVVSRYHAVQGANLPWDKQRDFFDLAENSFATKDRPSRPRDHAVCRRGG